MFENLKFRIAKTCRVEDHREGQTVVSLKSLQVARRVALRIGKTITALLLAFSILPVQAGTLTSPYTDSTYLTDLWFGAHSHWLQPWRAYLETVPAQQFLNGVGMGLPTNHENPDLILQMLAKHGVRNGRIEIGWSNISWDNESQVNNPAQLRAVLLACKKWNIRPLILLNANQGVPGPVRFFDRTVTANAPAGATTVQLNDVSNIVIGRSGLSNLTDYWAAEAIITAINGNTVTLSKPLPNQIAANTRVPLATLKYRPFSIPGSSDYNETIAAWQRYVGTVAAFTTETLGTGASSNKGFDLEIWNEMSFGSNFLYINAYYKPEIYAYNNDSIWGNLVKATVDYVEANSAAFQGVQFNDGFGNTLPWQASSFEPARIRAIGKHPYSGRKNFPADEQNGARINALGQEDDYIPTYSEVFPEYFATAIQTETLVRDMGPITSDIYGTLHGRFARPNNPTPVWITEVGFAPNENGITDRAAALALKAKTTARYYSFYLNKGVEKLQLYSATEGDLWLGIVRDNFVEYARTNTAYPVNDSSYVSPALRVTSRITAKMRENLDPNLTETRQLSVDSISDTHDHYQFAGDGTAAHPPLYNREVFAFLPYQANANRFVIPYYVMTRDVTQNLAPEAYTIQVSGLQGTNAAVTAYDPINDRMVPVTVNNRTGNSVNLTLTATDYPYLLVVEENAIQPGNGTGLKGEYFDNLNFTSLKTTRTDPTINFDWGNSTPPNTALTNAETFSVRWTGFVQAPVTGTYTFTTTSDDGVRLWVNNQQLINNWTNHAPTDNTGTISLTAGQRYPIKMEFYENTVGAVAKLWWAYPGQSRQILPQARLFPAAQPAVATRARFFPRAGFAGRMTGGKFQGSNDGVNYTDLAVITAPPGEGGWSELSFSNATAYRYLRFLSPPGGFGNVAEVEFYAGSTKLLGTNFGTGGSWNNQGNAFDKAFDGNTTTFFDAPDPGNNAVAGLDLGNQ